MEAVLQKPHLDVNNEDNIRRLEQVGATSGRRRYADADEEEEEAEEEDEGGERRCSASSEIVKERGSSVSDFRSGEVDLECGEVVEMKVHLEKVERDCRICYLSLDLTNQESGLPIELGCSCKNDLAVAHNHCAEAWFKIKGNKTCEICGSIAHNVSGAIEAEMMEQWNERNDGAPSAPLPPLQLTEARNFWQGHRFMNFLLACMVFAFVISWLFHFNVPK